MKIVITQTVALNGGDAAILFGLVRTLREAYGDPEITVYDAQPETASRLYPSLDFRTPLAHQKRGRLGRARVLTALSLLRTGSDTLARFLVGERTVRDLEPYRDADLFVWTGGTYLVEHYPLADRFFELELLRGTDMPLVLFTQSAGPFTTPENRRDVEYLGSRASRVLLRDARSLEHFADAGAPRDRLRVAADGAFALDAPATERAPRVVVSVRHWPIGDDADAVAERYVEAQARAIRRLVEERDTDVVLLSTCQGVPEYWTDDAATARRIVERLPAAARVRVDDGFHTPAQLIAEFGASELVLATRMHAAILALMGGAPVLPVAYEFKTRELFKGLGHEALVQDLDDIEPDAYATRVLDAYDRRAELRAAQQEGVARLRADAATLPSLFREATA
ncbi:MAG: polysaccharide pyruvyl transferase family protein [Planctomycetota bacterium]